MVKDIQKVTTVRLDGRMLENLAIIKGDTMERDGIELSNSDCIRKSLELLRQDIIRKEKDV